MFMIPAVGLVPWKEIIVVSGKVVIAARDIYNNWKSRPQPSSVNPHAEAKAHIPAILQRLEALEATETDQVRVVKEIAEQLQSLSVGVSRTAHRSTFIMWLAGGAVILSCITLVISLSR